MSSYLNPIYALSVFTLRHSATTDCSVFCLDSMLQNDTVVQDCDAFSLFIFRPPVFLRSVNSIFNEAGRHDTISQILAAFDCHINQPALHVWTGQEFPQSCLFRPIDTPHCYTTQPPLKHRCHCRRFPHLERWLNQTKSETSTITDYSPNIYLETWTPLRALISKSQKIH